MKATIVILGFMLVAASGAAYYVQHATPAGTVSFRTAEVTRGDLLLTISATGTVEPEEVVDVGAQVMGQILNSAPIPTTPPSRSITAPPSKRERCWRGSTRFPTSVARPGRGDADRSKADLLQLEAKCYQAEQDLKRAEALKPKGAISDTEYDSTEANYKAAKANIAVGKATIRQNEASLRVAQTEPRLHHDQLAGPGGHHRPAGQYRADGRRQPQRPQPVPDRQGPAADAGLGAGQRGRHRTHPPRTCRSRFTVDAFPGRPVPGPGEPSPSERRHDPERRHLHGGRHHRQLGRPLLPYLTANVQFEADAPRRGSPGAQRGAALEARPDQVAPEPTRLPAAPTGRAADAAVSEPRPRGRAAGRCLGALRSAGWSRPVRRPTSAPVTAR